MKGCKITKSKNGKINNVLDKSGNPSTLFKQIFNTPTLSLEESIEAYKNIYSEKFASQNIKTAIERNNGNPLNLAPNGKPSILYQSYKGLGYSDSEAERLVAQTYSDEFGNWFGRWWETTEDVSKVVDSQGQPLVVYHGTESRTGFTEFKKGRGKSSGMAIFGEGMYFSDSKDIAGKWGFKAQSGVDQARGIAPRVIPSFLNLRNPNEILGLKSEYPKNSEELGFDGVVSDVNFGENKEFVVYNPNQIKSATENIGTFDNTNPDIRFKIGEEKTAGEINQELIDRLKQNGLSEDVFLMSTEEIDAKLKELGVSDDVRKQVADYVKGYYSNANVAFSNLKDKNVKNVQGWIKALTDVQKNGGIKNVNQELEWIGLEDYLNNYVKENNPKAGNIPSSVVEDYIKSNQIEIVDVSKGGILSSKFDQEKYDDIAWQLNNFFEDGEFEPNEYNRGLSLLNTWRDNPNNSTFKAVVDFWDKQADFMDGQREDLRITNENTSLVSDDTKYSGYQLKGGENYREVLLTIPKIGQEKNRQNQIDFVDSLKKKYNVNTVTDLDKVVNDEERVKWEDLTTKANITTEKDNKYFSSHWDEANILAHVRLNEKTLPDGRKVLIINEIQSDWQSEGRKKGFGDRQGKIYDVALGVYNARKRGDQELADRMREKANKEKISQDEIAEALNKYGDFTIPRPQGVVDMPYANTDQYVGLVMRKVMQLASQEGYSGIAIATGQQSADMYSLSNQVEILYYKKNEDGTYEIDADLKNGDNRNIGEFVTEDKLADYVGKEVANKIIAGEGTNSPSRIDEGYKFLKGLELEVGGEGMKTFYDKIVPKVVQKEAQRFDKNAKLETVDFSKQPLRVETIVDGENYEYKRVLVDYLGNIIDAQYGSRFENDQDYIDAFQDAYNNSQGVTINKDKLSLGVQPYLPLTQPIKDSVSQGIPQFQKVLNKVGINLITNGFTYKDKNGKDVVVLNKDTADDSVAIHEFSHIFSKWQKENRLELWKKGQDLVKNAIENNEVQEIVDYVKTTQPNLKDGTEAFYDELLQEYIGRESKNMMDEQKAKSPLMQWLSDFWASIKDMLGLTSMTPEQVANLTLKEFAQATVADLLKGERIKGQEAQEYFTREADRLPLTLAVFSRPEFVKLQGKQVNPITVLNSLNQTGIKQIEKDLIKKVIEENYQGQKKISYDELEATVRANIMPLERIFTSSYADYGMNNLGDGNYGEANTIILNAPIEHGVTGHFSGDFKASGRQNIKYVPKQLNDNVWVAVEEGYESQANDNNIYQYVGTAGTKEAVDAWIDNYEKPTADTYSINDKDLTFEIERIDYGREVDEDLWTTQITLLKDGKTIKKQSGFPYNITEDNAKRQIIDLANGDVRRANKDINKGMFGHIRVWQDGDIYYGVELQSDYFQKINARKDIIDKATRESEEFKKLQQTATEIGNIFREEKAKLEEQNKKELLYFAKKQTNIEFKLEKTFNDDEKYNLRLFIDSKQIHTYRYKFSENQNTEEAEKEIINSDYTVGKYLPQNVVDYKKELENKVLELENKFDKDKNDLNKKIEKIKEGIFNKLSPQEKQFIASQKIWEQRMVREAIKEASLSGATSLRFPTPYTLSVIEGYLSEGAPYEIENANDSTYLEAGDRIYYAGEEYTVVDSDSTTITIAESGRVSSSLDEDIISQEVDNAVDNDMYEIENNLRDFYTQEEWNDFRDNYSPISDTELDEVGNEIEEGVFEVSEGKIRDIVSEYYNNIFTDAESIIKDIYGNDVWVNGNTVTWTDGTANIETLMQPSEYKGQGTKDSFSIEDDLDDTQQTVARKYEEIAEILKKEKPVEIVTDENGFDWYETKITPEEINNPVIAFQKTIEPNLTYQTPKGETFNTYQEALQNTDEGDIKLQINGIEIASTNSSTNIEEFEGVLNHFIKDGILTGERTLQPNGDEVLITSGETDVRKHFSADLVSTVASKLLGASNVKILNDGNVIITKPKKDEFVNKTIDQLIKEEGIERAVDIVSQREFAKAIIPTKDRKVLEEIDIQDEDTLVANIKRLLNKMGVKITSIEDYSKKFANKNDKVSPDSTALMDVLNKIMAFKNGTITRDDLIEETMHFIEATLDPKETEGLRKNIDKTPEWKEFSEYYRELYSREYPADKVDEMVRREILGKVMANGVKNNFAQETNSIIQTSVFNKIKELLQKFFDTINNYFKPEYQKQIDELNNSVYARLMNDELNLNTEIGTKFRLYSASNKIDSKVFQIQKQAEKALNLLNSQIKALSLTDVTSKQNLQTAKGTLEKAKKLEDKAKLEELIKTSATIVGMVQKQVGYLQRSAKVNEQNSYHFTVEEVGVYTSLRKEFAGYILPSVLDNLKALDLKEKGSDISNSVEHLISEIEKTTKDISELVGQVNNIQSEAVSVLADRIATEMNLNDEMKQRLITNLENEQKEMNWLFTNFGSLIHSSNMYLQMAAHVGGKTYIQANWDSKEGEKDFINTLDETGFLNKSKEFFKDGYLENIYNDKKREEDVAKFKLDTYNRLKKEENENWQNVEVLPQETDLSFEKQVEFDNLFDEFVTKAYKLTPFTADETSTRRKKKEQYSAVTQRHLKESSTWYGNIIARAEEINGKKVYTDEMRYDINQKKKQETYVKSIFNKSGNLKEGLNSEISEQEYQDSLEEGLETTIVKIADNLFVSLKENASDDAVLAFELNKITNERKEEFKNRNQAEFTPEFEKIFTSLIGKEAFNFLELNAYIGFTDEYYNRDNQDSLTNRLIEEGFDDNAKRITNLQNRINVILRANKQMNNPNEVNYEDLDRSIGGELQQIKDLSEELNAEREIAYGLLPKLEKEETEQKSETTINESFKKHLVNLHNIQKLDYSDIVTLEEEQLKEELQKINKIFDVVDENVIRKDKNFIADLRNKAKEISKGYNPKLSKKHKEVFGELEENLSEEEVYSILINRVLQYSYTRLLPYFKKNSAIGVDKVFVDLKNGIITPQEFIDNYNNKAPGYEYLKITPNFSFQEATEDNKRNPFFQRTIEKGLPLFRTFEEKTTLEDVQRMSPKQLMDGGYLNEYVSLEFIEKYGIDLVELYKTGEEKATKELKRFEARNAFLKIQEETLKATEMTGKHNIYLVPQKERGFFRKLEGKNVKEMIDNIRNFRQDEVTLGQDVEGKPLSKNTSNFKSIPKYGFRKITDAEATDELLESYIWMHYQAQLYKARKESIGDMFALGDKLMNAEFQNGLDATATRTYKLFEENMNYNYFGIKEVYSKEVSLPVVGKFNLGAFVRAFAKWISLRNLGFNLTIPITSALTGSVQKRIERIVGERIDKDADKKANTFFGLHATNAMAETLNLKSTAKINVIGEYFGFFESQERFNNSNYGKLVRGLGQAGFGAHKMANFPVNPRVGLSVLANNKFVDGKVMEFRQFKNSPENKAKTEKELRTEWKNYKDMLDIIQVDEKTGKLSFDYSAIATENNITEQEAEKLIKDVVPIITRRIDLAIQDIDQQIKPQDKSLIARHALYSFLGIHRSWLFLGLQRKFKSRHDSLISGYVEEGSWATLPRVITSIIQDARQGKIKNIIQYVEERWKTGDETTKKNLVRGITEQTVLIALVGLLVQAMKEMDDDDEDSYAFKLSSYFLMRTTNEIASSSSPYALPKSAYDALEGMVVGLNSIEVVTQSGDLFFGDEEVKRGRFRGLTERERYLVRHMPVVKEYHNLYDDLDGQIKSYNYHNFIESGNLDWTLYNNLKERADIK